MPFKSIKYDEETGIGGEINEPGSNVYLPVNIEGREYFVSRDDFIMASGGPDDRRVIPERVFRKVNRSSGSGKIVVTEVRDSSIIEKVMAGFDEYESQQMER